MPKNFVLASNLSTIPASGIARTAGFKFVPLHTVYGASQFDLPYKEVDPDEANQFLTTPWIVGENISFLPTTINFELVGARKYIDEVLREGELLRAYLDVNLNLRNLSPQARALMDEDLDRIITSKREQLQNVLAFQANTFKIPTYEQTTLDDRGPGLFPQVPPKVADSPEEQNVLNYWRSIREALRDMFSLKLEVLADAIGVSYATFANLGKMRPKEKTVAKVLRLHELARAVKAADPLEGADWLCGAGATLLREQGLQAFSDAVDGRVFGRYEMPQAKIGNEDEPSGDGTFPTPLVRPAKGGERF